MGVRLPIAIPKRTNRKDDNGKRDKVYYQYTVNFPTDFVLGAALIVLIGMFPASLIVKASINHLTKEPPSQELLIEQEKTKQQEFEANREAWKAYASACEARGGAAKGEDRGNSHYWSCE